MPDAVICFDLTGHCFPESVWAQLWFGAAVPLFAFLVGVAFQSLKETKAKARALSHVMGAKDLLICALKAHRTTYDPENSYLPTDASVEACTQILNFSAVMDWAVSHPEYFDEYRWVELKLMQNYIAGWAESVVANQGQRLQLRQIEPREIEIFSTQLNASLGLKYHIAGL